MAKQIHKRVDSKRIWKKIGDFIFENRIYIAAFLVPFFIMLILYIIRGVFPFGERSYMRMDFYHQYGPFMREFARKLKEGESLFFAFENGMGINYWAQYAYYLASPINWIYVLVPLSLVVEVMNFTMILRCGVAGLAFFIFLRKKYDKKEWTMLAFSTVYALSAYYLAYSCNIMWTDCYALFPLVILGVDELVRGKSGKWYGITMAICTISNFYIAVILGFCLLCYLPIAICARKGITFKQIVVALLRFAGITVVCVMIGAVIMLPILLALQHSPAGTATFPEEWVSNFNWGELLQRLLINMEGILNKSKLPNIYSSVFLLPAIVMFLGIKSIPWKEKVARLVVMIFLLLSFQWNVLDYVWHGLHFPNSFPARQAFFFAFLAAELMYMAYDRRHEFPKLAILISGFLELILLSVGWVYLGADLEYKGTPVYLLSILFIMLYVFILFMEKQESTKVFTWILLGVCIMECCINTFVTGISSTVKRETYVKNDALIATMLEDIEAQEGDDFYRVERLSRKTVNDAAWDGYNSVSYFSSTVLDDVRFFFKDFGLRYSNGAYSYSGATPLTGSLFGVKYLIHDEAVSPGIRYTQETYEDGDKALYLYTNTQALPLGFLIDSYVETQYVTPEERNPFLVHNEFVQAITGTEEKLFNQINQYKKTFIDDNNDSDEDDVKTTAIKVEAGELPFMFVRNASKVKVLEYNLETGEEKEYEVDDLEYRQNYSFGVTQYPREICVTPSDDETKSVNMFTYAMDQEVMDKVYDILSAVPMEIVSMTDTHIKATIDAPETATVLTTIPYDDGWTVKVDGEKVQSHAWEDAFLSVEVGVGVHELEFKYVPPGFRIGLLISAVGMGIAACLFFHKRKALKK